MIKKIIFFSFIIVAALLKNAYAQNSNKKFAEMTISEISALKKQQELLFLTKKKLDIGNRELTKYISIVSYVRGVSDANGLSYALSMYAKKTLDENIYNCITANTEKIINDLENFVKQKKIEADTTLLSALMYRTGYCIEKKQ